MCYSIPEKEQVSEIYSNFAIEVIGTELRELKKARFSEVNPV